MSNVYAAIQSSPSPKLAFLVIKTSASTTVRSVHFTMTNVMKKESITATSVAFARSVGGRHRIIVMAVIAVISYR